MGSTVGGLLLGSALLVACCSPLVLARPVDKSVGYILANNQLTVLQGALTSAGLDGLITNNLDFNGTLLAPTNQAFAKLLGALNVTVDDILTFPGLTTLLKQHVLPEKASTKALKRSYQAAQADPSEGEVFIDSLAGDVEVLSPGTRFRATGAGGVAAIVKKDLYTSGKKGVVHIIDAVLLPEDLAIGNDIGFGSQANNTNPPVPVEVPGADGGFGGAPPCRICVMVDKTLNNFNAQNYQALCSSLAQSLPTMFMGPPTWSCRQASGNALYACADTEASFATAFMRDFKSNVRGIQSLYNTYGPWACSYDERLYSQASFVGSPSDPGYYDNMCGGSYATVYSRPAGGQAGLPSC